MCCWCRFLQLGLSWKSFMMWTSTGQAIADSALMSHDLSLTLEYVFCLFISLGVSAVLTNITQCDLTFGQFFHGPKRGDEGYVKPWYKARETVTSDSLSIVSHVWCQPETALAVIRSGALCAGSEMPPRPIRVWKRVSGGGGKPSRYCLISVKCRYTR